MLFNNTLRKFIRAYHLYQDDIVMIAHGHAKNNTLSLCFFLIVKMRLLSFKMLTARNYENNRANITDPRVRGYLQGVAKKFVN